MSPHGRSSESWPSNPIGRRPLLRAATVGAGLAAAAGLLRGQPAGASVSPATGTAQAAAATSSSLPLISGTEFPVGLFWPPPPYYMSAQAYQDIADAGFNFVISGNYLFDAPSVQYALGLAEQAGLKMLVASDTRILMLTEYTTITDDRTVPSSISVADATTQAAAAFANYTSYSSFAGFNVYDEPPQSRFADVGALIGISRQLQPGLLPYVNLVPGNGAGYASLVQNFITAANPSLLSFDRYPILSNGIDINYFNNWVIIREASLSSGLPAWTYIQSTAYNGHAIPTASELAWQVNVSLAYGCTGIQYFTYWTPDPARGEGFHDAIILPDGTPSLLYDAAKRLNMNWLQPAGQQLKPLTSESVQHANDQATVSAVGVAPFAPGSYLTDVTGSAVIIGLFSATPDDGTRWLLVANRDPDNAASARVTVNTATVTSVTRFIPQTGEYAPAPPQTLPVQLAPGAAVLFRLAAS
jgi:hypothetical protein